MKANSASKITDRNIAIVIALLLLSVYLATTALRFHSVDGLAIFSVARSLVGHGAVDSDVLFWLAEPMGRGSVIAPGRDGHSYSVKDVGLSTLALPFVWLANQSGLSPTQLALLISPLTTAASAFLLYLLIRSWGYNRRTAGLGTLLFGLGSMAWPYAETFYTQPLAAFGLLVALYGSWQAFYTRKPKMALIGGIGLGIAGLNSAIAWLAGPLYLLFLLRWESRHRDSWKERFREDLSLLLLFCAGAAAFALGQAAYNTVRFGGPLATGHSLLRPGSFSLANIMPATVGMLFSTSRGVIWYAPFCAVAPFGARFARRNRRLRLWLLAAAQAATLLLFSSIYEEWWGGLAWGPRFLVAVMPALTLLAVPLLDSMLQTRIPRPAGVAVAALMAFSTLTQCGAASLEEISLEGEIYTSYRALSFPHSFVALRSLYLDGDWLPQIRLLRTLSLGNWDMWYLTRDAPTGLVVGLQLGALLIGICLLAMIARRGNSARYRWGIAIQSLAIISLAILMVRRDPINQGGASRLSSLISQLNARAAPEDCVLTLMPETYQTWIDAYDSTLPDIGMMFDQNLNARTLQMLERTRTWCKRMWVVTEGSVSGDWANGVERWLASNAFVAGESRFGEWRLISYSYPAASLERRPVNQTFGDGAINLVAAAVEMGPQPNVAWVNVWLQWQGTHPLNADYSVFVHLLDKSGVLVAQHDGQPDAGYTPSSTWTADALVDDRHQVELPLNLSPGEYDLVVGLYEWRSGERLVLANGAGGLLLATIPLGGR